MSADSGMKLTYFGVRARAEVTRYMFKLAGRNFEDVRVDQKDWPELKKKLPLGQMPFLEHGEKKLAQSAAIAGYVAREFGLAGSTNIEQGVCEMMCNCMNDVIDTAAKIIFTAKTEEEKAEARTKLDGVLAGLDKLVSLCKEKGQGQFILGEKASLADAAVTAAVEFAVGANPDAIKNYSALNETLKNFHEVPAIAAWVKERPQTPF